MRQLNLFSTLQVTSILLLLVSGCGPEDNLDEDISAACASDPGDPSLDGEWTVRSTYESDTPIATAPSGSGDGVTYVYEGHCLDIQLRQVDAVATAFGALEPVKPLPATPAPPPPAWVKWDNTNGTKAITVTWSYVVQTQTTEKKTIKNDDGTTTERLVYVITQDRVNGRKTIEVGGSFQVPFPVGSTSREWGPKDGAILPPPPKVAPPAPPVAPLPPTTGTNPPRT